MTIRAFNKINVDEHDIIGIRLKSGACSVLTFKELSKSQNPVRYTLTGIDHSVLELASIRLFQIENLEIIEKAKND